MRGYDPPHFDTHLTANFKTECTLSFVYSRLVRHEVGPGVPPGTFAVEPDLAERWEEPDDTTMVFYLRKGVRWHNKPPVNGRELTAEDVKFSFDRFLTEKGNPRRYILDPVDRVEVADRYAVRFRLKEPFVWLINMLANPSGSRIVAREVVEKYGDLKKPEAAIGTSPFVLDRHEPNVKTVFKRHSNYFRPDLPWVDEVHWMVMEDPSAGLSAYLADQLDPGAPCDLPGHRSAGDHRCRVRQRRSDSGDLAGRARMVATHRSARAGRQLLPVRSEGSEAASASGGGRISPGLPSHPATLGRTRDVRTDLRLPRADGRGAAGGRPHHQLSADESVPVV